MDYKEYNTVILAGLLHDIGKALNRVDYIKKKHPSMSKEFVNFPEFKEILKKSEIDLELLSLLVEHHHENPSFPEELQVQSIPDSHKRALAYIISRADNYSSGERYKEDTEKIGTDFRKERLLSPFVNINLLNNSSENAYYYNLDILDHNNSFPVKKEELNLNKDYKYLLENILKNLLKNFKPSSFEYLFNGLYSIFEKIFWCVPSDTTTGRNDVSLFDHLSTASAFAACLYQYHSQDNFNEENIKNDDKEKFLILSADLSGIQKFIFEIKEINPKATSKILRGRSYFLNLLMDITAIKILKKFSLPISCKIISAGGRFILLLPNTDKIKDELKQEISTINKYMLKTFCGKLNINFDYSISMKGSDFNIENFRNLFYKISSAIETKKFQKFQNEYFLNENKEKIFNNFYSNLKNGLCQFCGVYPQYEENLCEVCYYSKKLGIELTKSNFIAIGENAKNFTAKFFDNITVEFKDKIEKPENYILVLNINPEEKLPQENIGFLSKYSAFYVPLWQEKFKILCEKCEIKDECKEEDKKNIEKSFLTFECIATSTLNKYPSAVNHLALLKADVDNLGLIFSTGIKNLSISRLASISRMFDFFFTEVLKNIIKENYEFSYIVYSGGDDLLIIGPWMDIINLAKELNEKFKKFTGKNPDINISAGISLFKPNAPVKIAAHNANYYLEKSKNNKEKNSITLFDTTVHWENLPELFEFKDFLEKEFQDKNSKISKSFLYRLLKYQNYFLEAEKGDVKKLIYHSLLFNDLKRNIFIYDKNYNIVNKNVEEKFSKLYLAGFNQNKELFKNIKIPVHFILYQFRNKVKNEGGKV